MRGTAPRRSSRSRRAPAQDGAWDEIVRVVRRSSSGECAELTSARGRRRCAPHRSSRRRDRCGRARRCSPRGSRSGLRRRCSSAASASTSAPRCAASAAEPRRDRRRGRSGPARSCSRSTAGTARFPGFGRSLAVASSHIVLTEPVPDVLEELGWTGGETISRLPHAAPLLPDDARRPDRARLGRRADGLRRAAAGPARRRPGARSRTRAARSCGSSRSSPDGGVTHAWGGPIDVSPTHLPIFGSRGRVHHGFGFTGNGVGPSYLGGEHPRAARARPSRRVDAARARRARAACASRPSRFRWVGGSLIRRALVDADAAGDAGRRPGPVTAFVAGLPRRLGLRLPR